MKTLSIRQPWASLIVHGIKPVENREWKRLPTWEPSWLAIHSSQKPEGRADQFLANEHDIEDCVCGAIIGAGRCTAIVRRKDVPKTIRKNEFYNPDATVWLLFDDAIKIEPVFAKGRLGFWDAPSEAVKRIDAAIKTRGSR